MSMSTNFEIRLEDRILRVTLNRPEKRNALTLAMCRELVATLSGAERDRNVGAVLLSANGTAFSAGMDLDEALEGDPDDHSRIHDELFTIGARLAVPVVAAVSGPALGGGLGLVANAHVVVAAEEATFGLTEVRLGLWPFVVYRAVALGIGERRALELELTGRIFGARDALAWGLVHHVVPLSELAARAAEIAAGLAASSRDAIRCGMTFVNETRGLEWSAVGERARRARKAAAESADFREGVQAFREKRKAVWPSLRVS
jgi:enoyl-CoA hydratase/carnithine racemase